MDNREKAQELIKMLEKPFSGKFLVELLEAELNRLDNPEPKKWEPRGGRYMVDLDGDARGHPIDQSGGRAYPCQADVERAAPLHRKLDRLVNWLVEHHKDFDGEFSLSRNPAGSLRITFGSVSGKDLIDAILSGEVEL